MIVDGHLVLGSATSDGKSVRVAVYAKPVDFTSSIGSETVDMSDCETREEMATRMRYTARQLIWSRRLSLQRIEWLNGLNAERS